VKRTPSRSNLRHLPKPLRHLKWVVQTRGGGTLFVLLNPCKEYLPKRIHSEGENADRLYNNNNNNKRKKEKKRRDTENLPIQDAGTEKVSPPPDVYLNDFDHHVLRKPHSRTAEAVGWIVGGPLGVVGFKRKPGEGSERIEEGKMFVRFVSVCVCVCVCVLGGGTVDCE
jgi:hypothetical protein